MQVTWRKLIRRPISVVSSSWDLTSGTDQPYDPASRAATLQSVTASLEAGRAAGRQPAAARVPSQEPEDDWGGSDAPGYEPDADCAGAAPALAPGFYDRQLHPLLWVSEDRKEAHFLVSQPPGRGCSKWQYSYVGLRLLQFTDGELLVGWCSNSDCESCEVAGAVAGDCSGLNEPMSFWSLDLCECCQQMVRGVGGQAGLAALLSCPRPASSEPAASAQQPAAMFSRQLELRRSKHVKAVMAGPGLRSWGIMENGRCNSCRSNPCQHTAERRQQPARLDDATFEKRFRKDFDVDTGKRWLRCISQAKLPEDIAANSTLLGIYDGAQLHCMMLI